MDYLDLLGYLKDNNVQYRIIVDGNSIRTLSDILKLGLAPERIIKSLLLRCKYGVLVASIPMNNRLEIRKVRDTLGASVRFLRPSEIPMHGYEVGAVPPIYHRNVDMYLFDERLLNYDKILSGSGRTDKLIELNVEDIVRLGNPRIFDMSD